MPSHLTLVTLNNDQVTRCVCPTLPPPLHWHIHNLLSRGMGVVPALPRVCVSVSLDAGCAQILIMRGLEELLLAGTAWAPGTSRYLWQWLLDFRDLARGPRPASPALLPSPEPAPLPWLASFYRPAIRSLTPSQVRMLVAFERSIAVVLPHWAARRN